MGNGNHTSITVFILVGLSDVPQTQILLFFLFLGIYVISLLGNISIILIYIFCPSLNTPMFFCLTNLSFLEICYISSTVPKMLFDFLAEHKTISFYGCAVQMYCFLLLGSAECYILATMAYDRYNAICHPLLYRVIMNQRVCICLIFGSWMIGAVNAVIQTALTFTLPFCGANKVNHFFCDIPPVLELACADTWINEVIVVAICGCVILGSFMLIIISYICIFCTIQNISLVSGRKKAFSTCLSHFMSVTIFYGSGIFMYMRPKSSYSMNEDRLIAVMYTIIAPTLNPFIYTLRNNDVKVGVTRMLRQTLKCCLE
ncbi:olfactory receptor 5AR1-like [Mixophyes fleayi]|uniref:olfactory receptor 5AR1-like n=1 Tax=Mixophyes fleayi TaxID=3061075 RepID=UPI003F4D7EB3